ncbi:MAG: hypothetical protein N3J91_01870 [Verrucomicrobiae bacterium]|nr:hypothetical protein [Verrucomicrobiae bacterium]
MKKIWWQWQRQEAVNVLARFGQAELVVTSGGRMELRGGSAADVAEAREWISLFMHEAVPVRVPGPSVSSTSDPVAGRRISLPDRRPFASVGAPG